MPRHTKKQGNCVYCGKYDRLTLDHIIPLCLFPEEISLPSDIPKVYACAECNNKIKSGDDAYLRDVLVTNSNSFANPFRKGLYPKFLRSMNRNQSQMVKDLRDVRLLERRQINHNTFLDILVSQTTDERIIQIIKRITRGLYNFRTGLIMPVTTPILVVTHDNDYLTHVENTILNGFSGNRFTIGDGSVFRCVYVISPVEPIDTCWVLNFYNCDPFLVFTGLLAERRAEEIGFSIKERL